jgi:CubicO group peptidase (beta-lactamase class C family)
MQIRIRKYIGSVMLLLSPMITKAQPASDNPLISRTDSIVDQAAGNYFKDSGAVSLVIGVMDKGHRKYYGYSRSRSAGVLPDSNTIFEIGSITKTFTSWLFADAVIAQKITIGDPAKKWLPPGLLLGKDGKDITLLQLSNHSSGLPRLMNNFMAPPGFDFRNPYKSYTKKYLLEYLSKNAPTATPGSRYEYSNIAPAVLALALETIYDTPYAQLVADKIFIPLKMSRTFLVVPQDLLPQFAAGHTPTGAPAAHWDWDCMAPIGAIRSTAHDMLNYLGAHLASKNKAFDLCHQPTFKVDQNLSVGLAWHILYLPDDARADARKIIWHNGGTGGFGSFAGFDKDRNTAVIVMANNGKIGSTDPVGGSIIKQL